jgi:hypothetical protein
LCISGAGAKNVASKLDATGHLDSAGRSVDRLPDVVQLAVGSRGREHDVVGDRKR